MFDWRSAARWTAVVGIALAGEAGSATASSRPFRAPQVPALPGGAALVVRGAEGVRPPAAPWSEAWLLDQTEHYLDDASARRAALQHSLSNPDNLYSRMRLGAYGLGRTGWDVLPVWNPSSRPVDATDIVALRRGRGVALGSTPKRLWDGRRPTTMRGWVALGREVFFRYPVRSEPAAELALSAGTGEALGLHLDATGAAPGLVLYADVDGTDRLGMTCALCHSAVEGSRVVPGRARRSLDYGRMRLAYEQAHGTVDAGLARRLTSWGPGRADITEDDDQDPVAIPDLWRLQDLRHLTQAATIVHDSPLALALRQETQMLHASGERVRPPRELAWALAMYLYTLRPESRRHELDAQQRHGRRVFTAHCVGCHRDRNGSGPAIAASRVGVDASLARGRARGTGKYRPAPLVAVGQAAPYLHTGDVASLRDLLDPARLDPAFVGGTRRAGPIPGHPYGTDLPFQDRTALIAWLRTR